MVETLALGGEPRHHRRPGRRTVLVASGVVLVAATVTALGVTRPWRTEEPGRVVATGASCTVGYGTDLVVVAVEVANRSPDRTATLGGTALAPEQTAVRRTGGAIDIVTGTGCEHVLSLPGDVLAPRSRVWVGLTARVATCAPAALPVVVDFDGGDGSRRARIDVALAADAVPVCSAGGA